jgi:hypothetical protein
VWSYNLLTCSRKIGTNMPDISHYTDEKANTFISALSNGATIMLASELIGVTHVTAYNWRKQYPEFAARWAEAVEIATDCIESVISNAAISGSLPAAFYWLRHRRPNIYNREMMAKLAMLNAALAQQSAKGNGKVTVTIDENGIPHITENQRRPVVILPSNNRDTLPNYDDDPRTEAIEEIVAGQEKLALEQPPTETAPLEQSLPETILLDKVIVPSQTPAQVIHPDFARWKALSE